jgi:hypothetical protein
MPRMRGMLYNRSQEPLSNISVIALIFDSSNSLIASSETKVPSVNFGEAYPIIFTWPEPFSTEDYFPRIYTRLSPNQKAY